MSVNEQSPVVVPVTNAPTTSSLSWVSTLARVTTTLNGSEVAGVCDVLFVCEVLLLPVLPALLALFLFWLLAEGELSIELVVGCFVVSAVCLLGVFL